MDIHAVDIGAALRGSLGRGVQVEDIQIVISKELAGFIDNSGLINTLDMQSTGFVAFQDLYSRFRQRSDKSRNSLLKFQTPAFLRQLFFEVTPLRGKEQIQGELVRQ